MKTIAILLFLITPMVLAHNTCDIQNGTAWHKDEWHNGTLCHGHIRANGSGWWNYGTNGKVAGKWGVNENVGDCDSNNEDNNNAPLQTLQAIEEEVPIPQNQGNVPSTDNSGDSGGGGIPRSTPQPQTDEIHPPPVAQTPTPDDAEPSEAINVRQIEVDCSSLTGYAIEINDKNQIRLISPTRFSSELHLWFDDNSIIPYDEHITPYGVMFGFDTPKSQSVLDYNKWLDMDDLEILNLLRWRDACPPCENLWVADALKMVLMVWISDHICPVAEYPQPTPAAPRLIKPKLTTMWATLKGTL